MRYYRDRVRLASSNFRVEQFGRTELTTRNGEQPTGAGAAARSGVWLPAPPPEPTAAELEARRQFEETFDQPELKHQTQYRLTCDVGELIANANVYELAAKDFRQGVTVRVNYIADRVLKAYTTAGEVLISDAAASPDVTVANSPAATPAPSSSSEQSLSILYVNPQTGDDQGTGTETQPLRTITQAIVQARPGMTIQLQPGTYSAKSGEQFPLQLPPSMRLVGNLAGRGDGVQVTGGGTYLSRTWAGQSVTIVANREAQIAGLTITNPGTRGTGVWVETGSPAIENNRFIGSDREGVFVSGDATPAIRNNMFEQNGGNGLVFTRDSGGIAQGNVIRNQGFGIAIGDRAAPTIVKNQIRQNKDGLVINGAARPTLRSNQITENGRDGIIVTNNAKPVLEANSFADNGNYDLHNTTKDPLQLQRTNLATLKIQGAVN
jgi:parallel beta-helix repeat protein